jgi:hypothetical protein
VPSVSKTPVQADANRQLVLARPPAFSRHRLLERDDAARPPRCRERRRTAVADGIDDAPLRLGGGLRASRSVQLCSWRHRVAEARNTASSRLDAGNAISNNRSKRRLSSL